MVIKGYLREAGIDINQDLEFVYLDSQNSIVEAVKKGSRFRICKQLLWLYCPKVRLAVAATAGDFVPDFPAVVKLPPIKL